MAAPLTESATFDANVVVPEDGVDDETAASLVPAFQSLTNRARWLYTQALAVGQILSGGAMTLADNLDYTLANGKSLVFKKGGVLDNLVNFSEVVTRFNGKVVGKLFTAGQEGMANRKTLYVATGTGAFNVDADFYDTVFINSGITGPRQVILQSSTPDAHIKVISLASAYACNLQRPSGGGQIGPDVRYTAGDAFVVEALCCPDGTWRLAGQQPFTL